jgi:hypothetical protein
MMCPGDLVLKAPPGMFLVERFSKIEMLNIECSSSLNSLRENVLAEIDSYTHSTFRNLLIEGHIRVDSSVRLWAANMEIACNMSYTLPRLLLTVRGPRDRHEAVRSISTEAEKSEARFPVEPNRTLYLNPD